MVSYLKPNITVQRFYHYIRFKNVPNVSSRYSLVTQARCIDVNHCSHSKFLFPLQTSLPAFGLKYGTPVWRIMDACYSSKSNENVPKSLDSLVVYENISEMTLQSLFDSFEELLQDSNFEDWDVNYSNGVLTVMIEKHFTYVINKQTPNRQIWLSSPVSGPKRYDYIDGSWIYKHDGISLYELLSKEISDKLQKEANFIK